ncbi:helix-turn-helix domain-containing protein [Endozoicomonas sp.]|uniref:helix-turn-helix domain-containing protein n=1 Tax=Endozoicomonas sp. TaxID=1892382 RepID=UPI002887CA39|nr:AraC family transcriptional regulator ligand-binding domain-containing protein [Endozoicomonas sp.]
MTTEYLIPVNYVVPLLKVAAEKGYDIQKLAIENHLELQTDHDSLTLAEDVTPDTFRKLYLSVSQLLESDVNQYSQHEMSSSTLEAMCYALVECKNLRESFEVASHFLSGRSTFGGNLPEELPLYEFTEDGESIRMLHAGYHCLENHEINSSRQLRMVYSLALWHRFCCWLTGQYLEAHSVSLMGPAMLSLMDYRFHFECPIQFKQAENFVQINASALDAPIVQTSESLKKLLNAGPFALFNIEAVQNSHSLAPKMRSLLSGEENGDIPKLSEVAEMIEIPVRTLRRHLVKEGSSYQQVKDEYRRDIAIKYLSQSDISITSAALMMGFEELSAFHRSFKKWTGITPGEFRRRNNITTERVPQ